VSKASDNALKNLLSAGLSYGSEFAQGKLYGSEEGDETERQEEINQRNQVNGSGPVNAAASILSPKSWTDLFFGKQGAPDPGTAAAASSSSPGNGGATLVLVAVVAAIAWWLFKRA